MGRLARKLKRRALLADIPGGLDGALDRAANGRATLKDASFLERVNREIRGRNGYTGALKDSSRDSSSSRGSIGFVTTERKKDNYTFHTSSFGPIKEDGVFHCEESGEVTEKCPLKPKVPKVWIPAPMWESFINATKAYDTEWIALLIGKLDKDSKGDIGYLIEKYYFPPQVASGAHVEVPTGIKPKPGTIGAIHSHVNMGVFFSETDKRHSNWPVEIVINRKAEYKAIARHKLKCGEFAKSDTEVWLEGQALNPVVAKALNQSFVKGKALMEAAKKGSSTSTSVNVAEEDLVEAGDLCECGCPAKDHYNFENVGTYIGGCRKCKPCMRFIPKVTTSAPPVKTDPPVTIPVTGTLTGAITCQDRSVSGMKCTREQGHPGMCRDYQGTYFNSSDAIDDAVRSQGSQGLLGWPPFDSLTGAITLPSSDDGSSLEDNWDCTDCGGKGWVDKDKLSIECATCGGDGLTPQGRTEMAKMGEEMKDGKRT